MELLYVKGIVLPFKRHKTRPDQLRHFDPLVLHGRRDIHVSVSAPRHRDLFGPLELLGLHVRSVRRGGGRLAAPFGRLGLIERTARLAHECSTRSKRTSSRRRPGRQRPLRMTRSVAKATGVGVARTQYRRGTVAAVSVRIPLERQRYGQLVSR
jgi:hypothetical protein